MASSSTDLVVITNTLSNLKRLMTSEIENESPSKRTANSTIQLSMNSSEISMSHPEKKPWSSFLKPIQEKSKQKLQSEDEKREENVLIQVESEESVNQSKEEEMKEEEMKETTIKEEQVETKEEKEEQVEATNPNEEKPIEATNSTEEQPIEATNPTDRQPVETTNPKEEQSTTQEELLSEAFHQEQPIHIIPHQEQPITQYKEEPIPVTQSNSIIPSKEPQPLQQPLTLEQQVEKVLEDMDKQATIHQQYKPPSPSLSITPPTPSISIHHLNFVYIPHRGCVDRIRLLISYLNENPQFTYHLPPISSTTLSIPNFMQYMKEKQLPSMIIPILEIHTQQPTSILLLLHDQAIFSFLIQTYHLQEENPEKQFIEQNIEYTTQFILQELWWYEHSCEKEISDSQKIKLKKQFISTVLFPSLQIINSFLFQLHRNEPEEKLYGIDFALISLLTTLDNQFSIIIDLFIEMKEYYSQIMKQDFIMKCNRY